MTATSFVLSNQQKEILGMLNETPEKIAIRRKTSVQAVYKTLSKLEKKGYIKRIDTGVWEQIKPIENEIKPHSTLGMMEFQSNLHALQIEMPIIDGKLDLIKDFEGYTQGALKGWTPQYKRILAPIGLTIKNNNNKSVSIYIFSRELPRQADLTPLIMQSVIYTYDLLLKKGVKLDIFQANTKTLHISVRNDDLDKVFNKGEKFEVLLNRDCAKIFEADKNREAKAWVDSSPYLGVETNDLQYKENLIMQPERIQRIDFFMKSIKEELTPAIKNLAENLNLHIEVENRISNGIDLLNKTLAKMNSNNKDFLKFSIAKKEDVFKFENEIRGLNQKQKEEFELWFAKRFSG